jgi:hypothetical protein
VTPFKKMFFKSISSALIVESIQIGVENPRSTRQSNFDDLFLTRDTFFNVRLPKVCKSVKSISITDYWPQSSKKKSDELVGLIRDWTPMAASEKPVADCLDRAEDLLLKAMFRLEDEFGLAARLCFLLLGSVITLRSPELKVSRAGSRRNSREPATKKL